MAVCGYGHSGRVRVTTPPLVVCARICAGATPCSTQSTRALNRFCGCGPLPPPVRDTRRAGQSIELLQAFEVGPFPRSLAEARGHLSVVVDHATRHDELVVAADEREQLAAVAPEHIEVAEGISHVSNVARAVLRHLRILVDADGAPVEVQVMLVPVELRDPEEERSRPVQRRQVRAAIELEPDALAILVAWAVPDHVDRPRLQR